MCLAGHRQHLQTIPREAILVENRDLVFRSFPVMRRTASVAGDIARGRPQHFGCGPVAGEVPARFDELA